MREVVVSFLVEDNEDSLSFLELFAWVWRKYLANPGESYKVISDSDAVAKSEQRQP